MVQVLPEVPSFGTQLARGLGGGVGHGLSQAADFHKQMMLEQQKARSLAGQTKQLEKIKAMETGLGTIGRMRELVSSAGGWTSDPIQKLRSLVPGELQKDRAELEALGRSLIPLVAAGVPIRNQKEFEEYRKIITDPDSSPYQMEGALNGIQNLLERSIESPIEEEKESKISIKPSKSKQKFSSSNPEHKKKAEQLYKTYKDKEKVREILSKEFDF